MMADLVLLEGAAGSLHRWDPRDDPNPPAELRHRVAAARPCAVVRLVGVLDAAATDAVCAALLTFLADQPAAVVVDLTELAAEPAALALFDNTARESRRWPSGRLIISSPPGEPDPGPAGAELTVSGSVAEAMALLAVAAPEPDSRLDLDPVVGSARLARQFTNDRCAGWGIPDVAESACLVATELVNNVVAHAGTPMALRLKPRDGGLQLSVRDHSPVRPSFTGPASPTSTGGRGLLLIDTVAREWGTSRLAGGKVVWTLLHPDEGGGD